MLAGDPVVMILIEAAARGRELRRQREATQVQAQQADADENAQGHDDVQAQPDQRHDKNEAARG